MMTTRGRCWLCIVVSPYIAMTEVGRVSGFQTLDLIRERQTNASAGSHNTNVAGRQRARPSFRARVPLLLDRGAFENVRLSLKRARQLALVSFLIRLSSHRHCRAS